MSSGPPIWFMLAFGAICLAAGVVFVTVIVGAIRGGKHRSSDPFPSGDLNDPNYPGNPDRLLTTGAIPPARPDVSTPQDAGGHHSSLGSHESGHTGGFDGGGGHSAGHH